MTNGRAILVAIFGLVMLGIGVHGKATADWRESLDDPQGTVDAQAQLIQELTTENANLRIQQRRLIATLQQAMAECPQPEAPEQE